MTLIVNILDRGKAIQIIDTEGRVVTFSDRADGCYYVIEDICGGRTEGKASAVKNARSCAVAFLEKKGKHAMAEKLKPEYERQMRFRRRAPAYAAA